uniref:Cyclin-D1-binding protein 1 n=1 Tax=Cacopsylla melanoneura TaxID=428564 RepID=A0A8D8QK76_9HEMI
MESDMKSAIQQIRVLVEEKKKLLLDKSFGEEDNGEVFSREASLKIIEFLNLGIQKLSHTLTKMTILLSERPLPKMKEMIPLFNELSQEIGQFYEIFTTVYPIHFGVQLKQMYKLACVDALEVIDEVLKETINNVYNKEKLLKANGCVWETCNKLKSLPRDMLQLCVWKCQTEYDTLVDAEEELKSEINEHQESDFNFDDSSWSDEDLKLLTPASGLIKTAHSACKKIKQCTARSGKLDTVAQIKDLDSTCRAVSTLSPGVDDLVTSLYPPLVKKQVFVAVQSLLSALESILSNLLATHFIQTEDNKWIDFLQKAVQHNGSKLLDSLAYNAQDVASEMNEMSIS